MLKKLITISILAVSLSLNISGAKADTFMNWNVGVDIPVRYTPAITAGENGIILKGEQSNANKLGIQYELVKKDHWSDESFYKILIKDQGAFSRTLNVPPGKYQIKISGFGNIANGKLEVIPN